MSDVETTRTLRALLHVKDLRKSLAEAEYLRQIQQKNSSHQSYTMHSQRLDHEKATLPQQKAAILAELSERPVDLRKIHSAHASVRKLHHRIDVMKQEHKALEQKHHQACVDKEIAHRNFTHATYQQKKFQEIKIRRDVSGSQQSNDQEQTELEDRPLPNLSLLKF